VSVGVEWITGLPGGVAMRSDTRTITIGARPEDVFAIADTECPL
jgi:hypothetical protein